MPVSESKRGPEAATAARFRQGAGRRPTPTPRRRSTPPRRAASRGKPPSPPSQHLRLHGAAPLQQERCSLHAIQAVDHPSSAGRGTPRGPRTSGRRARPSSARPTFPASLRPRRQDVTCSNTGSSRIGNGRSPAGSLGEPAREALRGVSVKDLVTGVRFAPILAVSLRLSPADEPATPARREPPRNDKRAGQSPRNAEGPDLMVRAFDL